jgi:hypothetical protein
MQISVHNDDNIFCDPIMYLACDPQVVVVCSLPRCLENSLKIEAFIEPTVSGGILLDSNVQEG